MQLRSLHEPIVLSLALLLALPAGCTPSHAAPAPPPPGQAPPPPGQALLFDGTAAPPEDVARSLQAGATAVDLSDTWTPFIFQPVLGTDGQPLEHRYRAIYLGLASDTTDGEGQPLSNGEHNYLEVFGIPPTLSVLRARFLADAAQDRCADVDFAALRGVTSIATSSSSSTAPAKVRNGGQQAAFSAVEARLDCEGLFPKGMRHTRGRFDEAMRTALGRFQLKNKLYDAAALRPETMRALGRTPLDNDYLALVRTLSERAVAAAGVVEDGTAVADDGKSPATFIDQHGARVPVRDLVTEVTESLLHQLGLSSAQAALEFFRQRDAASFHTLHAAVHLPPLPEYYHKHMDLSVEIDRGDVNYDPPGSGPSRKRFPRLTLYIRYNGELVPLIHWRTTIGGWRSEQAPDGYEYFRYKGSDVGPRVWRNIVSAPVWVAPESTPLRSLVKSKKVNRASEVVVNYDELGPGYLSAYGLVAAYNVEPGKEGEPDGDNGVRVHGSSEYRSIQNPEGYSHGCHRLMNHLAERLFSFVLTHRNMTPQGERPFGFSRQFLWKNDVFQLRLPTRGFWYTLDPPVPVDVLEGRIISRVKRPFTEYLPKPGVVYPAAAPTAAPNTPESRAASGGGQ